MNEDLLAHKVYMALNKELLRRILIKYFFERGYKESMSGKIYPPSIQDIPTSVPQLAGKIDIQPHIEDVNPMTGLITLGWNLFILGNKRMYLGETSHTSLRDIKNVIQGPCKSNGVRSVEYKSPKRVISFIVDSLAENKAGDLGDITQQSVTSIPGNLGIIDFQGGYFKHNTFVN